MRWTKVKNGLYQSGDFRCEKVQSLASSTFYWFGNERKDGILTCHAHHTLKEAKKWCEERNNELVN